MMAGLQEGLIPLMCQLCEESNQIKWKCLQCNFFLCTKCKNMHKKVKYSDEHNIVDMMYMISLLTNDSLVSLNV
jgi:hypothetical protein